MTERLKQGLSVPERVLIIHADGNLFNNPTLKCLVDLLLAHGSEIDFRYPRSFAPMPPTPGIRLLPFGARLWRMKSIIFNRLSSYPLVFLAVWLEKLFLYRRYDLVIGVDRQGLIEAGVLHRLTKTPFVYVSFEIMFESETSARIKCLERDACRRAAFWIVQDEERGAELERENRLTRSTRFLLPLASAGVGVRSDPRLRDQLGIPAGKRVAMMMGSVADWAMAREILRSVSQWPDDWVLIVHERYGRTSQSLEDMLAGLAPLVGSKIFLSNAASELVDDMGSILAGIDAGLAFYQPVFIGPYLGKNLIHLGLASGKISTCLRYGVPVIMNEIGLYASEARTHGFGVVVDAPAAIPKALETFESARYAGNASSYFREKLDFHLYEDTLREKLVAASRQLG